MDGTGGSMKTSCKLTTDSPADAKLIAKEDTDGQI